MHYCMACLHRRRSGWTSGDTHGERRRWVIAEWGGRELRQRCPDFGVFWKPQKAHFVPTWRYLSGQFALASPLPNFFLGGGLVPPCTPPVIYAHAYLKDCYTSRTIRPERRRATCYWCASPWSHHADSAATAPVTGATTSPIQGPSLPVHIRQCTDVSGWRLSARRRHQHAPTPLDQHGDCVLFDGHTTPSVISFAASGPRLWNSLPSKIRQCDNLRNFKGCWRHASLGPRRFVTF